jgi:hypothetical protein
MSVSHSENPIREVWTPPLLVVDQRGREFLDAVTGAEES